MWELISSGRVPISKDRSLTSALRRAARTELNVAKASAKVPALVASDAIISQSAIVQPLISTMEYCASFASNKMYFSNKTVVHHIVITSLLALKLPAKYDTQGDSGVAYLVNWKL